jgi:hypothetical protein
LIEPVSTQAITALQNLSVELREASPQLPQRAVSIGRLGKDLSLADAGLTDAALS